MFYVLFNNECVYHSQNAEGAIQKAIELEAITNYIDDNFEERLHSFSIFILIYNSNKDRLIYTDGTIRSQGIGDIEKYVKEYERKRKLLRPIDNGMN